MKKILLLFALLITGLAFSQTQPTVINANLLEQAKSSGSPTASAAWINTDLGSQGENSGDGRAADGDAVKFDNLEADLMYQEVEVEPNSNYTFTLNYRYSEGGDDVARDPFVSPNFEVTVLKGSGYDSGYTITYQTDGDNSTYVSSGFGYTDITDVENAANQLAFGTYTDPGNSEYVTATLSFDTGNETSIALVLRATGYVESYTDGDDTYNWISGDSEVRTGSVSLVNNGLVNTSPTPQPLLINAGLLEQAKSSGSATASAAWINTDLGSQGENSGDGRALDGDAVKFDNLEADLMYQEVAVEPNSNYTFTFNYRYSEGGDDVARDPFVSPNFEVTVLKGSGYDSGYTITYQTDGNNSTYVSSGFGYKDITDVENTNNHLAFGTYTDPGNSEYVTATLSFDTGSETSIALVLRGTGYVESYTDGDDTYNWISGDSEIRTGEVSLTNNGYSANEWTGTTSSAWETATNWSLGTTPNEFNRVQIGNVSPNPIIETTIGAKAYTLNVFGGGTLTVNSGGSIIIEDATSGVVTYNRTVTGDNADKTKDWHLVSSPVKGETIQDLRTNNAFATSNNTANRIGIAEYNNTDEDWDYLLDDATGSLINGKGYSTRLATAGDITFVGSIGVVDVPANVTRDTNGLNLLGNPFASYINSKTFIDDADNTTEITNKQIWIWDSSANAGAGDYLVKPSSEEFQIAPGQGFFVEAAVAGSVTFAKENQSHQTDTFEKSTGKTEISLRLKDGTNDKFAKVSFYDSSTIGFDNGYEGELFQGVVSEFNVFTQLIENNGKNYQIQSLPKVFEDLIIPVGVKSPANKEITFSATSLNLPENLNVFIEDREENIFTNLNDATYKVTLGEAIDGVGRFFLHTSSKSALSVDDNLGLDNISIYKANASTLRIVGLKQGNARVKLFNALGKQVMNSSFTANGAKDISLPNLATGVYIVQLETETVKLNKKIILE